MHASDYVAIICTALDRQLLLSIYRRMDGDKRTVVLMELIVGGESDAVVDIVGAERHGERACNDQDGVQRSTTSIRRAAQSPLTLTLPGSDTSQQHCIHVLELHVVALSRLQTTALGYSQSVS